MSKHITMEMWAEVGSFDRIAKSGDTVDEDVAMEFLNRMPPLTLSRDDNGVCFFQNSEPYSHEKTDSGKFYAPTFSTFEKKDGKWYYLGNCFRGERKNRAQREV